MDMPQALQWDLADRLNKSLRFSKITEQTGRVLARQKSVKDVHPLGVNM